MSEDRTYFKSKGPSAFIKITRDELTNAANSNWDIGGESSLTLKHAPTIDSIEIKFGKGLLIIVQTPLKGFISTIYIKPLNVLKLGSSIKLMG